MMVMLLMLKYSFFGYLKFLIPAIGTIIWALLIYIHYLQNIFLPVQ